MKRLKIAPSSYEGQVSYDVLNDNGYLDEEIEDGLLVRFTEENVIWHVYVERADTERRVAQFMVYWPG